MGENQYLLTFSSNESMEDILKKYSQFLKVGFKMVNNIGRV